MAASADARTSAVNVLAIIDQWRQLLIAGEKKQLDLFLEEVEKRLALMGWKKEAVHEDEPNCRSVPNNRIRCWIGGFENEPRILFSLSRTSDRRIRAGTFDFHDRQSSIADQGSIADLAGEIKRVLTEIIEPAAATHGLKVTCPYLGPISSLSARTESAMNALAEAGEGEWPLPELAEPVWRIFVGTAYRDEVALEPEELTAWFSASGWSAEASAELAKRFYADAAILDDQEEARRRFEWR